MPTHRGLVLGELIAVGRTSEVHRCGPGLVAKVLRPGVPAGWAEVEASFTESVRALGVVAPEVTEVTTIEGRPAIVFIHVDGPSMWTRMQGYPGDRKQVEEAARILDLEPYLDRKPKNLSGGQRQRVAMGRAIVRQPQVFLMDEPLSNLDAKLRVQTRTELADLQARLGVTMVYVTHDQVEAMTMGHRVAVLKDGILQQVDRPRTLYNNPANRFVAGFIGSPAMNLVDVERVDGKLSIGGLAIPLDEATAATVAGYASSDFTVGIRPEHFVLADDGIPGEVTVVEALGSESFIHVKIAHQGEELVLVVQESGQSDIERGDAVTVNRTGPVHVFGSDGERVDP